MTDYLIHNLSQPEVEPIMAQYCASFLCQLRGLMFRRSLPRDRGLLLVKSGDSRIKTAIHMLFMHFDLTVVWINSAGEVVDVRRAHRWRPGYFPRKPARYTLEVGASLFPQFRAGDRVRFEELP